MYVWVAAASKVQSLLFIINHEMQQPLIREVEENWGTFRSFRKEAGLFGPYQKRMLLLMGFYWITASFFLILPFYFFKRPVYCLNPQPQTVKPHLNRYNHIQHKDHLRTFPTQQQCQKCDKDDGCVDLLCEAHPNNIRDYIQQQQTLTYDFQLFCGREPYRVVYKISPEALSWIGLIIYGFIADQKGRKVAFKISWRFYSIGLLFFTATDTQFLISFGYFIACINCFPSLVIQFVLLFQQIDRSLRLRACYLLLTFLLVAPLFASFLAGYMVELGFKITVAVLCTGPAIILSFFVNLLEESPIYAYKDNKLLAFYLINNIAKANRLSPITIDLSKSSWLKYDHYKVGLQDVFTHRRLGRRLIMSFFIMMTLFFNNRVAQMALDQFTNQYLRGTIMNSTSTVATITVIILITKYRINRYTYFSFGLLVASLVYLVVAAVGWDREQFIVESILSIAVRYASDLSYSLFLIYAIEAYPTVCRSQALSLTLCGTSFGVILAYSLSGMKVAQLSIAFVFNLILLHQSQYIRLDYENALRDTLADEYYDQNDRFKRV